MSCASPIIPQLSEGDIVKAKPKHFIPRPDSVGSVGQHPVIVLTRPDAEGYVLVAPMSHCHPEGTPTRSASRYGLPVDPIKGESRVGVGQPKVIHQNNLRGNTPCTSMTRHNFAALKADIFKNFQSRYYFNQPPPGSGQPLDRSVAQVAF